MYFTSETNSRNNGIQLTFLIMETVCTSNISNRYIIAIYV